MAETLIASDSFDRSDRSGSLGTTSSGGKTWVFPVAGPDGWGISGNKARCTKGSDSSAYIEMDGWDQQITMRYVQQGGTGAIPQLITRGIQEGVNKHYYRAEIHNDGSVKLALRTNQASTTQLTSAPAGTVSVGDLVTLESYGSTHRVLVNGNQVITHDDSSLPVTGGNTPYAGLRHSTTDSSESRFDDVAVKKPNTAPPVVSPTTWYDYVADNFDRSDQTGLGTVSSLTWTSPYGDINNWRIEGDKARGKANRNPAHLPHPDWDQRVQATYSTTDGAWILLVRGIANNTYAHHGRVQVQADRSVLLEVKKGDGTIASLGSTAAGTVSDGDLVRLDAIGNDYTVYVGTNAVLTGSNADLTKQAGTQYYAGFLSANIASGDMVVDNFAILRQVQTVAAPTGVISEKGQSRGNGWLTVSHDDFARGDGGVGTPSTAEWKYLFGGPASNPWSINNGKVQSNSQRAALGIDTGQLDHRVTATYTAPSSTDARPILFVRGVEAMGARHYYRAKVLPATGAVYIEMVDINWKVQGLAHLPDGTIRDGSTVTLSAVEGDLKLTVDGVDVWTGEANHLPADRAVERAHGGLTEWQEPSWHYGQLDPNIKAHDNSDTLMGPVRSAVTANVGVSFDITNSPTVAYADTRTPRYDVTWTDTDGKGSQTPGEVQALSDAMIPDGMVPSSGSKSIAIVEPNAGLRELRNVAYDSATDSWSATSGTLWESTTSSEPHSDDAILSSGLSMAATMVTLEEARRGEVRHVVGITLPGVSSSSWFYPAQAAGGTTSGGIPVGARLRLSKSLDVEASSLPPLAKTIAIAMQDYGMIVIGESAAPTIYGECGDWELDRQGYNPWSALLGNAQLHQVLDGIPWDKVDVLEPQASVKARPRDRSKAPEGVQVELDPASFYYDDLRNAPVAEDQGPIKATLVSDVRDNWNGHAKLNVNEWSATFYVVDSSTPRVDMNFYDAQNKGYLDQNFAKVLKQVPMPPDAVAGQGADQAVAVYDRDSDTLWEFWKFQRGANNVPEAAWGGKIEGLRKNGGRFKGWTGAMATGLVQSAGYISIAEAERQIINHALTLVVIKARKSTQSWPAGRNDGATEGVNSTPQGRRIRLSRKVDIDSLALHPIGRAALIAVQKHGLVVADKGGAVSLAGEDGQAATAATGTNPWVALMNGTPSYEIFKNWPWEAMEVLPDNYQVPAVLPHGTRDQTIAAYAGVASDYVNVTPQATAWDNVVVERYYRPDTTPAVSMLDGLVDQALEGTGYYWDGASWQPVDLADVVEPVNPDNPTPTPAPESTNRLWGSLFTDGAYPFPLDGSVVPDDVVIWYGTATGGQKVDDAKSVAFTNDGVAKTENNAPYSLFGDSGYNSLTKGRIPLNGNLHTVTANAALTNGTVHAESATFRTFAADQDENTYFRIYINGQPTSAKTLEALNPLPGDSNSKLHLGTADEDKCFRGSFQRVAIYGHELSQDTIAEHAAATTAATYDSSVELARPLDYFKAVDLTGSSTRSNRVLTMVGSPTVGSGGKFGEGCVSLNGTSQWMEISSAKASAATTGAVTVEFWVRADAATMPEHTSGAATYVAGYGPTAHEWHMSYWDASDTSGRTGKFAARVESLDGSEGVNGPLSQATTQGEWVHVAMVIQTKDRAKPTAGDAPEPDPVDPTPDPDPDTNPDNPTDPTGGTPDNYSGQTIAKNTSYNPLVSVGPTNYPISALDQYLKKRGGAGKLGAVVEVPAGRYNGSREFSLGSYSRPGGWLSLVAAGGNGSVELNGVVTFKNHEWLTNFIGFRHAGQVIPYGKRMRWWYGEADNFGNSRARRKYTIFICHVGGGAGQWGDLLGWYGMDIHHTPEDMIQGGPAARLHLQGVRMWGHKSGWDRDGIASLKLHADTLQGTNTRNRFVVEDCYFCDDAHIQNGQENGSTGDRSKTYIARTVIQGSANVGVGLDSKKMPKQIQCKFGPGVYIAPKKNDWNNSQNGWRWGSKYGPLATSRASISGSYSQSKPSGFPDSSGTAAINWTGDPASKWRREWTYNRWKEFFWKGHGDFPSYLLP